MKKFADIFNLEGVSEEERGVVLSQTLLDPQTPPDMINLMLEQALAEDNPYSDAGLATLISTEDIGGLIKLIQRRDIDSDLLWRCVEGLAAFYRYGASFTSTYGLEAAARREDTPSHVLQLIWDDIKNIPVQVNNTWNLLVLILQHPNCPPEVLQDKAKVQREVTKLYPGAKLDHLMPDDYFNGPSESFE